LSKLMHSYQRWKSMPQNSGYLGYLPVTVKSVNGRKFVRSAWRSRHRIRLRTRRPGFESRQGIRYF
jgi:hypothetical protein